MKRHKNWQRWGERRAQQHKQQGASFELVNKALLEAFFNPTRFWKDIRDNDGHFRPFVGGGEMRIPFQYQPLKGQPCTTE